MADHLLDTALNLHEDGTQYNGFGPTSLRTSSKESLVYMPPNAAGINGSFSLHRPSSYTSSVYDSGHSDANEGSSAGDSGRSWGSWFRRILPFESSRSSTHQPSSLPFFMSLGKIQLLERRSRVLSDLFLHSTYGQRFQAELDNETATLKKLLLQSRLQDYSSTGEQSLSPDAADGLTDMLGTHYESGPSRSGQQHQQSRPERASFFSQVQILSGRTLINLYRNPYLLTAHYLLSFILACK
jgi:hypothetical protein